MKIAKKEDGFTILEVLVASAILSIGLLGILSMMTTAMHANAYSEAYITANNLIIDQAEAMRRLGYGNITPGTDTSSIFTRAWTVTPDPFVPDLLQTVTVTVTWQKASDSIQHRINTTFSVGRAI